MTPQDIKDRINYLWEVINKAQAEMAQLEADYVALTCPWPKDTILRHKSGKLAIVNRPLMRFNDWAVDATNVTKNLDFGAREFYIDAKEQNQWRVTTEFVIRGDESGIVAKHKAQMPFSPTPPQT